MGDLTPYDACRYAQGDDREPRVFVCSIPVALVVLAGCSTTPSAPSATPSTAATPTTATTTAPPSEADVSTVQAGCAQLNEVYDVVTQAANGGGTRALLTLPDGSGKAANAWLALTDIQGVTSAKYRGLVRDVNVTLQDFRTAENDGDMSDLEGDMADLATDCQNDEGYSGTTGTTGSSGSTGNT